MKLTKKTKDNPMYIEYVKGVSITTIAESHEVDVAEVVSVIEEAQKNRK